MTTAAPGGTAAGRSAFPCGPTPMPGSDPESLRWAFQPAIAMSDPDPCNPAPSHVRADDSAIASPAAEPNYGVPAALVTPDGEDVITSEEQNFRTWTGRVDVVARVIELSARTGRTLRVLYTTTVDHATTGVSGDASSLDSECNVIALRPDATSPLVYCFGFGVLAHSTLVTLPGVPSEVTGVPGTGFPSPQSIAW